MRKRGQSGGSAAALVALIAGFIILYLLLLPPSVREDLLKGGTGTTGISTSDKKGFEPFTINKTIFSETPGRIEYLKQSKYDHNLPSMNLYTTTNAVILAEKDSIYFKNGMFDYLSQNVTFKIEDLEYTDNVLLSGTITKSHGRLRIYLNANLLYEGATTALEPISLPKEYMDRDNTLFFEVSPVGWKFWITNEYEIKNLKITADITDVTQQTSKNTFTVTDTEKFNVEKSTLKFYPECIDGKVGRLKVYINNEEIYSSIPECSQLNILDFSPDTITAGNNYLIFKTEKGYYNIVNIVVHTEMKKQTYPVYYFEADERLFVAEGEEEEELCGEVDGACPAGCDEDLDRDCCLEAGSKYWCDAATEDEGDRCVSVITTDKCNVCKTGYEDENNNPPSICKGFCGDDTDNKCPSGCNRNYDKDCCYGESKKNYWCDDVPIYGISDTCKQSLTQAQCDDCPSSYETKEGSFICEKEEKMEIKKIRPDYEIYLRVKFIDDGEKKAANVYVNGHKFYINTYKEEYEKNIGPFLEPGSNAIKIEPDIGTLDIRKLDIYIKKK